MIREIETTTDVLMNIQTIKTTTGTGEASTSTNEIGIVLTDETGKEEKELFTAITPDTARKMAAELTAMADFADNKNKELRAGVIDPDLMGMFRRYTNN